MGNVLVLGEKRVDEKSNEITAIPALLEDLDTRGHIITIDAMGCQTDIAKKIRKKRADYVLALKANQVTMHEEAKEFFANPDLLRGCAYQWTVEKARSGIEVREYWQSDNIAWLSNRTEWAGLKPYARNKRPST